MRQDLHYIYGGRRQESDRQHLQPRHRIKRYQEHEHLEREIREEDRLSKE